MVQDNGADLRRFVDRAEHLLNASLFRDELFYAPMKFTFSSTIGLAMNSPWPDDEKVEAAMTRLRPFTLKQDTVHLPRVWKYIKANVTDVSFHQRVDGARDWASKAVKENFWQIQSSEFRGGSTQFINDLYQLAITVMVHESKQVQEEWEKLGEDQQWIASRSMLAMAQVHAVSIALTRQIILDAWRARALP